MRTRLISVNRDRPEPEKIQEISSIIKRGGIAAVPTETVYGLACDSDNRSAVENLYNVKRRPKEKLFAIQIADFSQIKDFTSSLQAETESILREFWPGPLTAVIDTKKGAVGLRMPDNKVTLSVIEEAKVYLAVTSANISGGTAVYSAKEAFGIFDGLIDAVVDDGTEACGIESTVIDFTASPYKILREGALADRLRERIKQNE